MIEKNKWVLNQDLNAILKWYLPSHEEQDYTKLECSQVHYAQMPSVVGTHCCVESIDSYDSDTFKLIKGRWEYHNILCSHQALATDYIHGYVETNESMENLFFGVICLADARLP